MMATSQAVHVSTRYPILIVEQDPIVRTSIAYILREENYVVIAVGSETMALDVVRDNPLSLVILDSPVLLSHTREICQKIRSLAQNEHIPILLAVTRESEIASIERLGLQVTDYIVKPFIWEELLACVGAIVRHRKKGGRGPKQRSVKQDLFASLPETGQVFTIDDLFVDTAQRTVYRHNQPVEMKSKLLFDLLVYFLHHRGIALTREQLLLNVWGYDHTLLQECSTHTVSVHIHWLRELLENDPDHPQLIKTVRGIGYRFKN